MSEEIIATVASRPGTRIGAAHRSRALGPLTRSGLDVCPAILVVRFDHLVQLKK
jgi:hypothetical protein